MFSVPEAGYHSPSERTNHWILGLLRTLPFRFMRFIMLGFSEAVEKLVWLMEQWKLFTNHIRRYTTWLTTRAPRNTTVHKKTLWLRRLRHQVRSIFDHTDCRSFVDSSPNTTTNPNLPSSYCVNPNFLPIHPQRAVLEQDTFVGSRIVAIIYHYTLVHIQLLVDDWGNKSRRGYLDSSHRLPSLSP